MKILLSVFFAGSLACNSLFSDSSLAKHVGEHIGWTSMYCLPQSDIKRHFASVKGAVDHRWDLFGKKYDFALYTFDRDESSIVNEFYQFSNERVGLWLENESSFPCQSSSYFKLSQEHLRNHRFRQPCCITFEHSATDPSYNCTSIRIGNRRFFALEGPTEENVTYFFQLLVNWNVGYLVCLTDEMDERGTSKCFPYWKDRIIQDGKGCFLSVKVHGAYEQPASSWGDKNIPYFFWPDWHDHHGVDPKQLIQAVNGVREKTSVDEILAVHCSAGVGRTGTFIAAICLLEEIDEQVARGISPESIEISISKLFFYMNFYRPWLVAKPSQYLTLYRTVDEYLSQKIGNSDVTSISPR